jgi:hypothetical protein
MEQFPRIYDAARKAQGFKTAEDWAAFLAYFDHTEQCAECRKPGKPVFTGDGWQPTQNRCDHADSLYLAWEQIRDAA